VKTVIYKNDPSVSSVIWPSFKETLTEKHGHSGTKGDAGESNAFKLIESGKAMGDGKLLIWHQDALHQMMGIDFTFFNGKYYFIDAKSGSSSLYYDKQVGGKNGWYITLRASVLNKENKTDIIMHLGPKGDIYAWYFKKEMRELFNISGRQEAKVYFKDWPKNLIRTNLW